MPKPGSLQLGPKSFPIAGNGSDDQECQDRDPRKPFGRVFDRSPEGVDEEVGAGMSLERAECRPVPVRWLEPHRIEDLVGDDAGGDGNNQDAGTRVFRIDEYPGKKDQEKDEQGMEEDPAGPEDLGEEEKPDRLVDEVREDASEGTGRDEAGVPGEDGKEDPKQDAGKQVGEGVH